LRFLKDSAYLISIHAPTTSAVLGSQYDKLLEENDLDLQASKKEWDAHRRNICGACGSLLIPGITCSVAQERIPPGKSRKETKGSNKPAGDVEKSMVYSCSRCYRKTSQPVPSRRPKFLKKGAQDLKAQGASILSPASSSITGEGTPRSVNASSKKRAKARKQSGLQAMLA
ncbi:hypothetical protein K432DRAFT_264241, partial [Lepidopterella palustris CBS 459.81]